LKSYANKLNFLTKILGQGKYNSGTKEAEFFSPWCNHRKPKLSINLETDHWRCFISGKNGKKLLYVIRESGGSKSDIQEYLQKYKAKNVVITKNTNINIDFRVEFPRNYIPLVNCQNSLIGKKAYKYLSGRGVTELDILRHKIGVVMSGDYSGMIIFPSFSAEGYLNLFAARSYGGTYLTSTVPRGYKNTIVINELNIDWTKPIVLVEGFVDMIKSISNTVPLFGSSMNYESLLFEKIVENSTPVVMGFDPDAQTKADKIANRLSRFDVEVFTLNINGYEDIGAMKKEEFMIAYDSRSLWTPESSFREKLRVLC